MTPIFLASGGIHVLRAVKLKDTAFMVRVISQDIFAPACLKRAICWASHTSGRYCHQMAFIEHAVTVL